LDTPPEKFIKELKEGQTKPIYLFYGEENYSKEEAIKRLKEHLFKIYKEKLLVRSITPESEEVYRIVDTLKTIPLFGGKSLVIVRDFDVIPKSAIKEYVNYCKAPNKINSLVLLTNRNDLKGINQDLVNSVSKNGCVVKFQKLEFSKLLAWIKSLFKDDGIEISDNVAFKLLDLVGNDRSLLNYEINKLCLFFHGQARITLEDLSQYLTSVRQVDIFDLADSFLDRDHAKISRLLQRIFEQDKDSPLKLIGIINKQLAILLEYKAAVRKKIPKDRILHAIAQGKTLVMRKLEAREKLWEEQELRNLLSLLRTVDKDIKQGGLGKPWLEALLFLQ